MPNAALTESGVSRAIVELDKASAELRCELTAMKVRRARDAKRRVPRGGLKDCRGRRRSVVTFPGYHSGREPASKGLKYPPTPPTVSEVLSLLSLAPTLRQVQVLQCPVCKREFRQRHAQDCINPYGERLRALIYIIWRGGLRIDCEALRLTERDLHPTEGHLYVANGKGGKAREVVIDDWMWPAISPWVQFRQAYPPGPLFCVLEGETAGVRKWAANDVRLSLHKLARLAGINHRIAPHQFRHARAIEDWGAGIDPLVIGRNLGHAGLHVTDNYFKGLPQSRITEALRARPVPTVSMLDVLRSESLRSESRSPDLMGALR